MTPKPIHHIPPALAAELPTNLAEVLALLQRPGVRGWRQLYGTEQVFAVTDLGDALDVCWSRSGAAHSSKVSMLIGAGTLAQVSMAAGVLSIQDTVGSPMKFWVPAPTPTRESGLPLPAGTLLREWVTNERSALILSGAYGALETIDAQSEHPANIPARSRSAVGELVMRKLKKDGTPGKSYLQLRRGERHPGFWVPCDWPMPGATSAA